MTAKGPVSGSELPDLDEGVQEGPRDGGKPSPNGRDGRASVTPADLGRHPCFSKEAAGSYGRVHVPVAPKCNIQCVYCNRKYSCTNESRPGVTRKVLSPWQVVDYVRSVRRIDPRISVVGIAGPGDAFANPDETLETLHRLRTAEPDIILCLSTNGLNAPAYVDDVKRLGVSHVTVTINAVDPEIGAGIYRFVRHRGTTLRGREAAERLLVAQLDTVARLKTAGVVCKVNTVLIPGLNDHHVLVVAEKVAALGADLFNCVPLIPSPNTPFADQPEPPSALVEDIRRRAAEFLPQMSHCTRCRSDAVGMLGEDCSSSIDRMINNMWAEGQRDASPRRSPARVPDPSGCAGSLSGTRPDHSPECGGTRPATGLMAVASTDGETVDCHLGTATALQLWARRSDGYARVGSRPVPPPGTPHRWERLAHSLEDCCAVIAAGIGPWPREALAGKGLVVMETGGSLAAALRQAASVEPGQNAAGPGACVPERCGGDRLGCD